MHVLTALKCGHDVVSVSRLVGNLVLPRRICGTGADRNPRYCIDPSVLWHDSYRVCVGAEAGEARIEAMVGGGAGKRL